MTEVRNLIPLLNWFPQTQDSFLKIAGPCSAESREQVLHTAEALAKSGEVAVFRAGVWKPRTRPNTFEGVGEEALEWLKEVKQKTGLPIAVEVATPEHVEKVLRNKIDVLWIGARTTGSPFAVSEISEALRGVDIPVLVKNPISPDLGLWIGTIERLNKVGIKKLAAVHRGFSPFEKTKYRNIPKWELAIELKSLLPELPLIIDPSHMAGCKEYLQELSQQALDLAYNGLMIETHCCPEKALSDAGQQLTPNDYVSLIKKLIFKHADTTNNALLSTLEQYRNQIDSIDSQLIELLAQRMEVVKNIGYHKQQEGMTVFQLNRWKNIIKTRLSEGTELGLSESFVKALLRLIHKESILLQKEENIMEGLE